MIFAETAHLRIRGYKESDLSPLVELFSDPHKRRGDMDMLVPQSETMLKEKLPGIVNSVLFVVLETKEPGDAGSDWVGFVALNGESASKNRKVNFSISIVTAHWGKGYGTEATIWVVNHAFTQLGMHRVSLGVLSDNPRAITLYKNVGFAEEGRAREANFQDGRWWDTVQMSILEREWKPVSTHEQTYPHHPKTSRVQLT